MVTVRRVQCGAMHMVQPFSVMKNQRGVEFGSGLSYSFSKLCPEAIQRTEEPN